MLDTTPTTPTTPTTAEPVGAQGHGPAPAGLGVAAGIGSQLLGRIGPRPLLIGGPALAALGMLSRRLRLEPTSSATTVVLPGLVLLALGTGPTSVALPSAAVAECRRRTAAPR